MKKIKIIGIISKILVLVAVFLIGFYVGTQNITLTTQKDIETELVTEDREQTVSVIFDFGGGKIKAFREVAYSGENNVFDIIENIASANDLEFSYTDYGGDLGVFIESIDNTGANGVGKWWQFWVNQEYSEKGASNYMVESGDVIEFKYIESQI